MKIFIDSANLKDIEEALKRGFPSGITTNPSILAKEEKCDFKKHIRKIIGLVKSYGYDIPLSVEVFTKDPDEMIRQAEELAREFSFYENINIKVPIGWDELKVIHALRKNNVKVNCTCNMSVNQAIMAAQAGADFVSLFYGRIRDGGEDPYAVVSKVSKIFKEQKNQAQIIIGSIRQAKDVSDAITAGADIVTVPPKFFTELVRHHKTDEVVDQFIRDFQHWLA